MSVGRGNSKACVGVLALVLVVVGGAGGPGRAETPRSLSLEQAITEARAQHPALAKLGALVRAAEARVAGYDANLRPVVAAGATGTYTGEGSVGGTGPGVTNTFTLSLGVTASWVITDFGRTPALQRAAKAAVEVTRAGVTVTLADLVFGVQTIYYEAAARRELVKVERAALERDARHVEEATRFVAAGTRPPIDVLRAKTLLARTQTSLTRAEASEELARAQLVYATGGDAAKLAVEVTSGWPAAIPGEEGPVEALVDEALRARPELDAARRAIAAAQAAERAADSTLKPSLSASAQAGVGTRDFDQFGPAWTATLKFAWPLYDGGATAAAVDEARAEAEASQRDLEQAVLDIRSEVVQASLAIRQAKATGLAARAAAEAAQAELKLAEARYQQGLDSGIEWADVQAQLVQTQAEIITADWSLAVGRAQLLHALGRVVGP